MTKCKHFLYMVSEPTLQLTLKKLLLDEFWGSSIDFSRITHKAVTVLFQLRISVRLDFFPDASPKTAGCSRLEG